MYLCLPIFNDEKEMICKNCGTEFEGNFCNHCGQKSTVERLTWKSVWDNILHGIFHVDNTFVKTTRTLVVHPDRLKVITSPDVAKAIWLLSRYWRYGV